MWWTCSFVVAIILVGGYALVFAPPSNFPSGDIVVISRGASVSEISKQLSLDVKKHNSQYSPVDIRQFDGSHDRFLVIDEKEVYHFGASLKDLGKRWFAFSKFEKEALALIDRLGSLKPANP